MRTRHNAWVKEGVPQDSCRIRHTIHFAILKLERTQNWKQSRQGYTAPAPPCVLAMAVFAVLLMLPFTDEKMEKQSDLCKEVRELGLEHSNGWFPILRCNSYTQLICHQHHLCTDQQSRSLQQGATYSAPAAARANWTNVLPVSQTYPSSAHDIWLYTGQSHTQLHLVQGQVIQLWLFSCSCNNHRFHFGSSLQKQKFI